jgi:hypothetical protein
MGDNKNDMTKTSTFKYLLSPKNRLLLLLLFLSGFLSAQPVHFLNTFGGASQDIAQSAIQTFDKQYVCVGATSSYGAGSSDIWIVKTWSNGFPRWNHCIGGTGVDWGYSVKETPADSGLIIAGYTDSYGAGGYDCYLIKTDSLGNVLWSKTYGGSGWDFAYSVANTSDGGYILAGGTYSYGAGDEDVYVVKTNSTGDTLWTRHFGGRKQDEARSVKQTADGGYILAGMTKSFNDTVNGDAYVIRLNPSGDTLWTRASGGRWTEDAHDVIEASDKSIFLIGATDSFSTPPGKDMDIYMAKFRPDGSLLNIGHLGGPAYDRGEAIVETSPLNFTIVGSTKSYGFGAGYQNVVVYFMSQYCNWAGGGHTYGDTIHASDAVAMSLCNTADKGYLVSGYTTGFSANGIPDFLLIKLDSVPAYVPVISGISTGGANALSIRGIYPNPANEETSIQFSSETGKKDVKFRISDLRGRDLTAYCQIDLYERTEGIGFRLHFNRELMSPGMYFVEMTNSGGTATAKIMLR